MAISGCVLHSQSQANVRHEVTCQFSHVASSSSVLKETKSKGMPRAAVLVRRCCCMVADRPGTPGVRRRKSSPGEASLPLPLISAATGIVHGSIVVPMLLKIMAGRRPGSARRSNGVSAPNLLRSVLPSVGSRRSMHLARRLAFQRWSSSILRHV